MSTTQTEAIKNIIFVTGSAAGDYKELAQELTLHLYHSVFIIQPFCSFHHFKTPREAAVEKSLFFSQVLFYGSLPSRKSVVIAIPDLTMRTILQFLLLFEKIKKNVFVVVDDRYFVTSLTRQKFKDFTNRLPSGCSVFVSDFITHDSMTLSQVVDKLADKLVYNSRFTSDIILKGFNNILESIPGVFRDEIKKSVFGSEFGDIPFNQLVKNLLPEFNDAETEEIEEDIKKLKLSPKKTITEYFKPIPKEPNEQQPSPIAPSLNIQESEEDEFISLMDVFSEDTEPFIQASQLK